MRVVPVEKKQLLPRPPVAPATPNSAGTTRPTATRRTLIRPRLLSGTDHERELSDPYVRRYWTAAIGPGAVADLLRLIRAAQLETTLPRPDRLPDLVRVGLAAHAGSHIWVPATVPDLPPALTRRLSPSLRREHNDWLSQEQPELPTTDKLPS